MYILALVDVVPETAEARITEDPFNLITLLSGSTSSISRVVVSDPMLTKSLSSRLDSLKEEEAKVTTYGVDADPSPVTFVEPSPSPISPEPSLKSVLERFLIKDSTPFLTTSLVALTKDPSSLIAALIVSLSSSTTAYIFLA